MELQEQTLETKTYVKFSFVDRIKILFGQVVILKVKVIIPDCKRIDTFNSGSEIEITNTTGLFIKQNLPPFGYSPIIKNIEDHS